MAMNNYSKGTAAPAKSAPRSSGYSAASLPAGYLSDGYKDKNGNFDIKYITSIASEVAKQFGYDNVAKSKVRDYYNSLCTILDGLRFNSINMKQANRELSKMKPRVTNRGNKGTTPKVFVDFINKNVDLILNIPDDEKLQAMVDFKDHFESVVGYMR